MEEIYGDLMQFMRKPAIFEAFVDILLCAVPIWVAVMIGLVIGWSWRPRWTGLIFLGLRSRFRFIWTAPPGLGARRLWLAFTALSAFSVCRKLWSNFKEKGEEASPAAESAATGIVQSGELCAGVSTTSEATASEQDMVTQKDLEHLLHLLDGKVGESTWQNLMERSTPNMLYQAWRHEPEVGPTIYRSRTIFEDATPELVRDFFWDDDFRAKWDHMLAYFKLLEECPLIGMTIVHWIKKFPFFCSDREYIIGRRIWESGKTFYCVTKGVPYPALQKHDKPRRVELYFSSWRIRAMESRKGDRQLSACEVSLVHYEDMGIPKDVANVGVRHGMWGAVKKLQSGMRAYQLARKSEASLSPSALSARITTKISVDDGIDSPDPASGMEGKGQALDLHREDQGVQWKWVVIGGTVALVCGLQTGIIGRALLLGAAQRIARR
ncbi:uncharacterized protein LOC131248994 [Magnolia sinica]|uniref:uncharacterized protein LOC131248994 n=1 Tax=Magnolia sinica TaxID=86752 RepID=UPI002657B961|nr:uncharacterized protein LOC131248994 [Magnolia sinica]